MDDARGRALPAATIGQIARLAGEKYSQTDPGLTVNIQFSAVVMLQMKVASDAATPPLILELKTRQRQLLDMVSLAERLWRLGAQPLPLNMEFSAKTGDGGSLETWTELEYLLRNWRQYRDEMKEAQPHDVAMPQSRPWPPPGSVHTFTNAAGIVVIPEVNQFTPPELISDPIVREQYRRTLADYEARERQREGLLELAMKARLFTNAVIRQVAAEYGKSPHLVAQLQEVMDGYLPPADSTNVMNKVFAAMKSEVAAKTPRPVPGAKGERWLRPAAAPAGPVTPAVARPNRVVDAMRQQQAAQAAGAANPAQAESPAGMVAAAGGKPLWAWVGLGLVALAGGWVWVRTRG